MQLPIFPLDNKYQIIRMLGEGGFGRVWLARNVLLTERYVAIKQLRSESLRDSQLLIEEMGHLSALDHPHVVKFLHHFEDAENLYLVMEYCAGGSLDAAASKGPLAPERVFRYGKIISETLAEVHQRGIVHHDIKPQNLLLTDDGRLKIADFGVANRNWGTRTYMAPEIALGEATTDDGRIDIYALGISLLELLLGHNPLKGLHGKELLRAKIMHMFVPPTLDRWIQEIVLKATHPTPELRFQSMADFSQAIDSRHVPYIIDRDRLKAHRLAEKAGGLIARKKWITAKTYIDHALRLAPDCISALVIGGRLELLMRRTARAKIYFSKAVRISPRVNIQKELGWIALEEGNHAQALSMLTDHLQREAADYEANNLLIQCFFETGRYELGAQLAGAVLAQKVTNDCFENNEFLCRLMLEECSPSFLADYQKEKLTNPFMRINFDVATESPSSWSRNDLSQLKSKLLFQDYRFGTPERRRKPHTLIFEYGDGESQMYNSSIVTVGRYSSNDLQFNQNGISRRHAAIVNFPGDVWIYDTGSVTGVTVDGIPVSGKAFLDGVHELMIGNRAIKVATREGLLV